MKTFEAGDEILKEGETTKEVEMCSPWLVQCQKGLMTWKIWESYFRRPPILRYSDIPTVLLDTGMIRVDQSMRHAEKPMLRLNQVLILYSGEVQSWLDA